MNARLHTGTLDEVVELTEKRSEIFILAIQTVIQLHFGRIIEFFFFNVENSASDKEGNT